MDNILPGLLIVFFILFFLASFWLVLKTRDDLFAVLYAFLFVYTIFTQIGYVFFPELAVNARVYFGSDLFYSYWVFVTLSFVSTLVVFFISNSIWKKQVVVESSMDHQVRLPPWLLFFVVGFYLLALTFLVIQNYQYIQYANIENIWLGYLINSQPLIILVMYMKLRKTIYGFEKTFSATFLIVAVTLFTIISFRAGQRLLGFSLLVGVATFELSPFVDIVIKYRTRLFGIIAVAGLFLFVADRIVYLRDRYAGQVPIDAFSEFFVFERSDTYFDPIQLVRGDYFSPSSLIFVSIKLDWINTAEVLRSNIYNYIPFTKYPYLQNILSEAANPFYSFSRSESYGYYLLTEGFNFAGWWGILYNGVMVNVGLGLWRLFASSRDRVFNRFMVAILSTLVVGLVRSPSVFFVRSIYLAIIPSVVLVSLVLGYWPQWQQRTSSSSLINPAVVKPNLLLVINRTRTSQGKLGN